MPRKRCGGWLVWLMVWVDLAAAISLLRVVSRVIHDKFMKRTVRGCGGWKREGAKYVTKHLAQHAHLGLSSG